jgi:hypothetical protein
MIPDAVRLPFSFDPARLRADLIAATEFGWTDHFVKRNYEGSWSAIALRGPAHATHPIQMIHADPTCTDFRDTPILERCRYFQLILERFACPLEAVRLMRLTPGSVVLEHRDHDLSADDGHARIHIPVTTNPSVVFLLNQRRIAMQEGECWYLRLSDPHAVRNDGTTDRVHLVIDAVVDPWLLDRLAGAPGAEAQSRSRS